MTAVRRRLVDELVRRGLAPTAVEAQAAIETGRVTVAGAPAGSPARLVSAGEDLHIVAPGPRFVSRAGVKLAHALNAFDLDVAGARVLDVGSSTGGFTDCLLQHDAASVVAVDVGTGQLAWSLRTDPRVDVHERTDVRTADPAALGAPFAWITVDVSFIGLARIASTLAALLAPGGRVVALVKPQFEAGRDDVPADGIVRDPVVHLAALRSVVAAFGEHDLIVHAVTPSPIRGSVGNVEFVVVAAPGATPVADAALVAAVDDAAAMAVGAADLRLPEGAGG